MLVANFMRFRRKRLEKQTHLDNFSLKKNPKRVKKSKSTIRENFTFFQKRNIFKFDIHVHRWKKKSQKKFTIFFPYTKIAKQKKFAISKISNKKFRKIHYFTNIKYKRNSRKYCEKNLRRYIFWKKNFRQKKFYNKIFHQKKNFVEKTILSVVKIEIKFSPCITRFSLETFSRL